MTETCESCGMARHDYGLNGCVNLLLHENARLHTEVERLWEALNEIASHPADCGEGCAEALARMTLNGRQHGPSPACRECGMGGDVGGTQPNPIPF